MVYRSGKAGSPYYVKRFSVKGITHDKDYDLTMGEPGSKVVYFSANPNGEAEVIKVMLRPQPKLKKTSFDYNFAELMIKGRASRGNKLTNHPINKIVKRDEGVSTLAAREIWYDDTVKRLNADKRGTLIGEFSGDDKILQIYSNGEFRLSGYDLSTHFDDDMTQIMKFNPDAIFSVIYIEGETKLMYITGGINILDFSLYYKAITIRMLSFQFSHSVVSDSLRPHESQHSRPPHPSPSPSTLLYIRWIVFVRH